jgi:poly(3-hydroxybutyrate) depolymerase
MITQGTPSQRLAIASLASAQQVVAAAARGGRDYLRVAGSPTAGAHLFRWWATVAQRRRPSWSTPHKVVAQWPVARLRDFSTPADRPVSPTLLLPPQAGHDSCIVDFAPGQSQIQVAQRAGLHRLWSLDWVGATAETRDAGISDYIEVLDATTDMIGEPVNLVGDCQGGWLAAIYAALRPQRVRTLTLAGAPIDFHAGESLIHDWVRVLDWDGQLSFYRLMTTMSGGVLPGQVLLGGFIALAPEAEIDRQLQLLGHLDDSEHVARYQAFEDWFKHTQPIPGRFYLWIVRHLFRDNALIRGDLHVDGVRVDLGRIDCPLFLVAGSRDHITPAPQVFALAAAAATPDELVHRRTADAGHLGLFTGHHALDAHWPEVFSSIRDARTG